MSLIADVSSEFMARPLDVRQFAMLYGGAQKTSNRPSVVLAIVRRDLYARASRSPCQTFFNFPGSTPLPSRA